MDSTDRKLIEMLRQIVDKVHDEGGVVRLDLGEGRWRKIHFLPRMDRLFIAERLTNTVRVLGDWSINA